MRHGGARTAPRRITVSSETSPVPSVETEFTPWAALIGGGLIGLSSVLLMLFLGRIAGIIGVTARAIAAVSGVARSAPCPARQWSACPWVTTARGTGRVGSTQRSPGGQ